MQVEVSRRQIEEGQLVGPELPMTPVNCGRCGATHLVSPEGPPAMCPSCGRGTLEPSGAVLTGGTRGAVFPESVVPFVIDEAAALKAIAAHVAEGGWFLTGDTSPEALRKTLQRLWWPEWLVDADLDGVFSLEVGFNYQVESAKERFNGTDWQTFHEIDTRIRWEPRVGRIRRRLHNVRAVAHIDHSYWYKRLGGTDRSPERSCEPADLQGAAILLPNLPPDAAWSEAVPVLADTAGAIAQAGAEAEHKRDLAISARWANLNWTWRLLPAWTASYDDGSGQRWLFVVNGQTGKVTGARLKSPARLWAVWGSLAASGFGVALLGAFLLLLSVPLLAAAVGAILMPIGIILFVFGLLFGIFVCIPLFEGLSWNREQRLVQPPEKKR